MYYYVYILQSINFPDQIYIGYTTNLKQRFAAHNSGKTIHSSKYAPWELVGFIGFNNKNAAVVFERYIKTQSGRAFAYKHFWKHAVDN